MTTSTSRIARFVGVAVVGALSAVALAIPGESPAEGNSTGAVAAPSPYDVIFDNIAPGQTAKKTLTVANKGDAAMVISGMTIVRPHPDDFSLSDDTCTNKSVAPAAKCTVTVNFKPTQDGTRVAHLRIAGNFPCPARVTLAGGGFVNQNNARAKSSATCTVTNTVTNTQTTTTTTPGTNTTTPGTNTTTPGTNTNTGGGVLGVNQNGTPITKCKSNRKVRIHFRTPRGTTLKKIKVTIRKKSFKVKYSKKTRRYSALLTFKGRKPGRYQVKIRGKLNTGKAYKKNRYFVTCLSGKTPPTDD